MFLTQSRKGAKKALQKRGSALRLCAFAVRNLLRTPAWKSWGRRPSLSPASISTWLTFWEGGQV